LYQIPVIPYFLRELIESGFITKNFEIAIETLIQVKNIKDVVAAFFISKYWLVNIG
jgi:hypothetical protein